jgi:hypothetical protein
MKKLTIFSKFLTGKPPRRNRPGDYVIRLFTAAIDEFP